MISETQIRYGVARALPRKIAAAMAALPRHDAGGERKACGRALREGVERVKGIEPSS